VRSLQTSDKLNGRKSAECVNQTELSMYAQKHKNWEHDECEQRTAIL
jgi:hypothetical protein